MTDKEDAEIFGQWLTERMEEHDLTVTYIAREVGADSRTVTGWRNGRGSPRGENMWRLFSVLGYPIPAGIPRSTNAELADINAKLADLTRSVGNHAQALASVEAAAKLLRGAIRRQGSGESGGQQGQ